MALGEDGGVHQNSWCSISASLQSVDGPRRFPAIRKTLSCDEIFLKAR